MLTTSKCYQEMIMVHPSHYEIHIQDDLIDQNKESQDDSYSSSS